MYIYDKINKTITKILSKETFNIGTSSYSQTLNFEDQHNIINNDIYIYVVLINDYDCKPFQNINYLYGLCMRNLYFEGGRYRVRGEGKL